MGARVWEVGDGETRVTGRDEQSLNLNTRPEPTRANRESRQTIGLVGGKGLREGVMHVIPPKLIKSPRAGPPCHCMLLATDDRSIAHLSITEPGSALRNSKLVTKARAQERRSADDQSRSLVRH
jgi:hypothetical protein